MDGATLYLGSDDGTLYAVAAESGAEQWKLNMGGALSSSPILSADGAVVFALSGTNLFAIDAMKGDHKWRFVLSPYYPPSGRPSPPFPTRLSLAGGTIIIGSSGDTYTMLFAINASTGQESWSLDPSCTYSSPAFSRDRATMFLAVNDQPYPQPYQPPTPFGVLALNTTNGKQVWRYTSSCGSPVSSLGVVSADGATIFIGFSICGGTDGTLLSAFDSANGTIKWSINGTDYSIHSSSVTADGATLMVLYEHPCLNILVAIDPMSGKQRWRLQEVNVLPTISADGATAFVRQSTGCKNGYNMFSIDVKSGTRKWSFKAGDVISSPPALSADGATVLIGSGDDILYGDVYAVGTTTGAQKWKFETAAVILSWSPFFSVDGMLAFIGSADGCLHAVEAAPSLGQQTGRAPQVS